MDENNAVDVIRELINTNRDGEKGYKDAADHAKAAGSANLLPATCR